MEITTVTITQPCQWNCFTFGYQSNRCHSLAVHKKELTLLYHTFSPENAWCLLKLYKDLWLGYIHDMSLSIWMTTALVLQPPALHWCCWSSNDYITDQKHSRAGSSPRDAQNSWKIPLLPLNMTRQAGSDSPSIWGSARGSGCRSHSTAPWWWLPLQVKHKERARSSKCTI